MKAVLIILGYFVGTIVLGAAVAPALYRGLHALEPWALANGLVHFDPMGDQVVVKGFLAPIINAPFPKVFDRAMLLSALVLLLPAIAALRIRGRADLRLQADPRPWLHLLLGFGVAGGAVAAMAAGYLLLDFYHLKSPAPWGELPRLALTAAVVALVEEGLFRGAILGLFLRSLKPWMALFWTTLIFALLHYLKPQEEAAPAALDWLSGFRLLPGVFHQFLDPWLLLADFTTLFTLGWLLGWARLRTGALWMSIGIHAGVVLTKMAFSKLTKRDALHLPWVGPELQIGLVPVALLLLALYILWRRLEYEELLPNPRRRA